MCIDLRGIRDTLLRVSASLVHLEGTADPATFIRRAQPKEDVLQNLNNQLNSVSLKEYVLTIFAFEREMAEPGENVSSTYVLNSPKEHCNSTMLKCSGAWIS